MSKTIDPAYEGYAGIPRQRSAYTGGAWYAVTCIDIGRAKGVCPAGEQEEGLRWTKSNRIYGGRPKGESTLDIHAYMLENGPSTATQLADRLGLDPMKVQNIFQRNVDLFSKQSRGVYVARSVPG